MRTSKPALLKDRFWKNYVDEYVNEPGYWYQPKGLAISRSNLPLIRKLLRELARFEGKRWDRVQRKYTMTLARKGLLELQKPLRAYKAADLAAKVRMNKMVLDTLGVAWVDRASTVLITDTGRQFLRSSDPADVIEKQLLKYQLSNPAVRAEGGSIRVFPHLFLLDLLLRFVEDGIDRKEYVLFVARARSHDDLGIVEERIRRYRGLPEDEAAKLVELLKSFPVVREGRLQTEGRRSGLYNTVNLDASYELDFFAFPKYMARTASGGITIPRERLAEAVKVARSTAASAYYTEFDNEKDWVSYYGDPKCSGSVTDAMEYYESRSDVDRAVRAFLVARSRGLVGRMEPGEYMELRVKEKMLEDLLEYNLYLLETGLVLVGRQYPTPTGPIDLLARDSRRHYVVIELKKGRAADKVVGQLQRYRGFILQDLARPGQRVRGMIVSQTVDKGMKYAVHALRTEPVQLFKFAFQADVKEVKP